MNFKFRFTLKRALKLWLRRRRQQDAQNTLFQDISPVPPLGIVVVRPVPRPITTSRAPLPVELKDVVLEFIGDDIPSLRTAALISRSWTAPAQRHLFHTKTVVLSRAIQHTHSPSLASHAKFFSAHAHIAGFVTTLCLCPGHHSCCFLPALYLDANSGFVALVKALPNLQHLIVEQVEVRVKDASSFRVPTSLCSVKSLKLRLIIDDHGVSEHFLNIFRVEDHLEITGCVLSPFQLDVEHRQLSFRHLKVNDNLDAFPTFGPQASFARLRALTFNIAGLSDSTVDEDGRRLPLNPRTRLNMDQFLTGYGSLLTHLRLDLQWLQMTCDIDPDWTIFQLAEYCPDLRSLHLGFSLHLYTTACLQPIDPEECQASLRTITRVLASAPRTVTSLVVAISGFMPAGETAAQQRVETTDDVDAHWGNFADVISAQRFPELREVKFLKVSSKWGCTTDEWRDPLAKWVQQLIAERFPRLIERNILRFE